MSKELHAKLRNMVVRTVSINLDPDKMKNGKVALAATVKSQLKTPKSEDDLSFLLVSSMEVKSQGDEEAFCASFKVNFFFSIEEKLIDYDQVVREQCLPIIQDKAKELTNMFLSDMGFPGVLEEQK